MIDFEHVEALKEFSVSIKLCQISAQVIPESLNYTLGDPSLEGGMYSFDQSDDCPSSFEITVNNVPGFIEHHTDLKQFSI